jgi:hypothetical protein
LIIEIILHAPRTAMYSTTELHMKDDATGRHKYSKLRTGTNAPKDSIVSLLGMIHGKVQDTDSTFAAEI